ncbi:MAG TPA: hypothetical protein VI318_13345 [Baekduia sp.]
MSDEDRTDPRLRPPDPAGTQPKYDPGALLPKRRLAANAPTLWAPPAQDAEDADPPHEPDIHPRREDEAPAAQDDGDVAQPPAYSRYSHRIQFALGALLAVGVAGVVLLVAALLGDRSGGNDTVTLRNGPAWSPWKPAGTSGEDLVKSIADHVGRQYRLPNGQQLVSVFGGPMAYGSLPVTVAIQKPVSQGGDVELVDGVGVIYRLCAIGGKDCRITYGKPTVNRHMLLAREALELALYSFRYVGVSQAVVLMPPTYETASKAGGKEKQAPPEALLFRRGDPGVASAIAHPLAATLARRTPSVDAVTRSPDATAVGMLTGPSIYNFRFQASNQDARAFLVLKPVG